MRASSALRKQDNREGGEKAWHTMFTVCLWMWLLPADLF